MIIMNVVCCYQQARMKARPPLAVTVSTPSTSVSAPPPPQTSSYVIQGQNGVVSPPSYTVSSATVGPLTTPKCAYQTLPAVQYIQHPVSCITMFSLSGVVYEEISEIRDVKL